MTWVDVLFFIGIVNGGFALMNAYMFYRSYDRSPLWLKVVLLSAIFGCVVSFVSTMRFASVLA